MNYRKLPHTDIEVSEISFGCWTMGGLNWIDGQPDGWADVDADEITAAVRFAVDAGVNHFDNADIYGHGKAERMLARAIKKLGVKSDELIISSKVGHFKGAAEHPYHPAHIRHQCEQSLINLRREYIDIYYFHHGNFGPDDKYLPEALAALDALIQQGKVRVKGLSAYHIEDFVRLVPKIKPAVLQSWAHVLDDQFIRSDTLQNIMAQHHLAFVAFSPLAQGRLLDKYDPDNLPVFEPGDHRRGHVGFSAESILELKPKLQILKKRFGPTAEDLAAVALNYVLAHPHVACVIPGFRNQSQAQCNASAAGRYLTDEDITFIRDLFTNLSPGVKRKIILK
jgi:myo-inositol catabolism protein IolS